MLLGMHSGPLGAKYGYWQLWGHMPSPLNRKYITIVSIIVLIAGAFVALNYSSDMCRHQDPKN